VTLLSLGSEICSLGSNDGRFFSYTYLVQEKRNQSQGIKRDQRLNRPQVELIYSMNKEAKEEVC
jgi:hypothetical protein